MWRPLPGLLLGAVLACAPAPVRAGEPEEAAVKALADPADPGHAKALEAWAALPELRRVERVLAGIASEDRKVARFYAALADPLTLSLEEIRRAMAICADDPAWVADPFFTLPGGLESNGLKFGTPDLPAITKTAATTPDFAFVVGKDGDSDEFHRAMDASVAAALVPFLETKNDAVRKRFEGWLELAANVTTRDETRPAFARGFLYLLERRAALKAGKPVPSLASIEVKTDGPGVPPALKTLILDAVRDVGDDGGHGPGIQASEGWPYPFPLRWARSTKPVPEDLPFLVEVSRAPKSLGLLASWAVRALAVLDPKGEASGWTELASRDDGVAVAAAAELARRGQVERLRSLADSEGDLASLAQLYSFEVDPDRARARYLAGIGNPDREHDPIDLSLFARAGYAMDWGVTIADADLLRISSALCEGNEPRRGVVWFHAQVMPEAITPAVAEIMGKRLLSIPDDLRGGVEIDSEELDRALAQLEVRAPEVLRKVLLAWAAGSADMKKETALVDLARLGDATHVDAMLASFAAEEGWFSDSLVLGRVKDPKVVEFFLERLRKDTDREDWESLETLAVARGLPESLRWALSPGKDDDPEPLVTVRKLLIEGDAKGALFALLAHGRGLSALGEVAYPEALEVLRRARKERFFHGYPAYWIATKALAAAGDADARREWLAFLRDGRVRVNDGEDLSVPRSLANDPEVIGTFLALLDTNCCLGWQAYAALSEAFPTAPLGHIGPNVGRNRLAAEPWFAAHRGTFVWSRILDAWLPGPGPR